MEDPYPYLEQAYSGGGQPAFAPAAAPDVHEHHHPQEEAWTVLEGELAVWVDGEERTLGPGEVAVIPPDVRHRVRALTRDPGSAATRKSAGSRCGTGRPHATGPPDRRPGSANDADVINP